MTRLEMAKNEKQGIARRVLCVCSAGVLRSPTAAFVLQKHYGHNTRSCGMVEAIALIPISEILVEWADEIVCMEIGQAEKLRGAYPEKAVQCLNIADRYWYMQDELVDLVRARYQVG